jgi:hypothetical protein
MSETSSQHTYVGAHPAIPAPSQTPESGSANSPLTEVSSGIFSLVHTHTRARQHLASVISFDIKLLLKCFLAVHDKVVACDFLSAAPSPKTIFLHVPNLNEEADQAGQKTDTRLQN